MTNVALVTVDSLRADHVGWGGYERPTTPRLDDWAADGHVFESCFSLACATRPSFPAILSSVHPLMYGGYEQIHPDQTLVSEALTGHAAGGFHSNLYLGAEFGYDRGWDTFYDSSAETTLLGRARRWVKNNLPSDNPVYRLLDGLHTATERSVGVDVGSYYTPAEELTDRALGWARSVAGPTFLWVHYMEPHHPYVPAERHFADVPRRRGVQLRQKMLEHQDSPAEIVSPEELETIIDLYDDEIRAVDRAADRLLSELDRLWDDWTAIVTADHGEEFLEHGEFSHGNYFYDETMHDPLVVWDGAGAGRYDEIVATADIPPTITDIAGAPTPDTYQGRSLAGLLAGDGWDREHVVGGWSPSADGSRPWRLAYRDHRHKYVRDDVAGEERWYDLRSDPEERHPDASPVAEITATVDRWEERIEAHQAGPAGEVSVDAATRERLRRLGYRE